jgi:hypothetical protein
VVAIWVIDVRVQPFPLEQRMSRLASFRGPSSPSVSPVRAKQPSVPSSPSRVSESTFHRKIRTLLQELRGIAQSWDNLVLVDGLRAAKSLVDARTELEYVLDLCTLRNYRQVHVMATEMRLPSFRTGSPVLVLLAPNWP